jgi:hypothetical protein
MHVCAWCHVCVWCHVCMVFKIQPVSVHSAVSIMVPWIWYQSHYNPLLGDCRVYYFKYNTSCMSSILVALLCPLNPVCVWCHGCVWCHAMSIMVLWIWYQCHHNHLLGGCRVYYLKYNSLCIISVLVALLCLWSVCGAVAVYGVVPCPL